ncbi:putative Isoquinoline 1-oxidoreductase subunit beta (large chain) (iorB) [Cupriavidus taiwanensis]|uniref:Isoquinoline 1-oxidoreductase subunit beta (Large chain) (IorB) n=1 Tax=Cupriavidus taiwanensis TaxID=164546 RepID=A0A375E5X1_9BURK|nr:xanthine dehydrogenase family protein molybdopterin-binding subunit [Cupriavidus taiwanensis]SOZ61116.1 putative Isoquinoline 1-oxidoreductase subunit beta (large chain) (iorB) [Cupriavidus taiwanensis]SOZ61197.1 putative Isoquinoline 1-oxidoreductase subunit beta (large chain) (iorB) [Cupriavidus taiwanensis]SOZ65368.1 putative Isoquinoline 1-oxidoreductase subunit beta (large chain) (iorB) [Cupriavidus taiwanensis]SPA06918.1 putative Isoquinoline 1-oxidoreductase subunit beta (large chain)
MRIRGIEALAGGQAGNSGEARADAGVAALDRRSFLKLTGLAGGGLALGVAPLAQAQEGAKPKAPPAAPQAFLIIAPDNTVTVAVNRLEFGQGVHTALPMALAEELDADWRNVRAALAPAGDPYKDPGFGMQMTGGSTALNHSFQQYRELGARARAMLVAAAAQRWKVDPASCKVEQGVITSGSQRATFGELAPAAMELPVPQQVTLKDPAQFRIVGKPTPRLDARGKMEATTPFGIDTQLKGMVVAVVARPPRFGGKVKGFSADKARAVPGVRGVLPVPVDRGGSGVAVVASGYWPAKMGRDALEVQWEDAGSKVSSQALFDEYAKLAAQPGTVARAGEGNIAAAINGAPRKIEADFRFPYLAHAPMEPLNCTLQPEVSGGKVQSVKVWVGSQFQTVDQAAVARTLGLAPDKVVLNTMMAGGGFGRRAVPTSDYIVEAANVLKAWVAAGHTEPLKVVWSREDDIRGGYYRPLHLHRARIGLDAQGKVVGWQHTIVGQSILKGTPFEPFMVKNGVDATMTEGIVENDYDLPLQMSVHHPQVDVPVLWWRSVGNTHTAFVKETLADEMAAAAKQDPVAFRLARLDEKKHARHRAALQLAVEKSGYGKRKLPKGHAWGVAVHESFSTVVAYVVDVSLVKGEPRVHRVTAGVHANRVVNPLSAEAQIQGACVFGLAMTRPGFAIEIENGAVKNSNFPDFPPPRITDAPVVDVFFVPSQDNPTGLGEPGVPPIAPAVANALFTLTGKRQRQLPFVMA